MSAQPQALTRQNDAGRGAAQPGAYGRQIASCFRVDAAPTLITRTLKTTQLAVTRLTVQGDDGRRTAPVAPERAYLVSLQLRDVSHSELWLGAHRVAQGPMPAGSITIVHLEEQPSFTLPGAFDSLLFYFPQLAFDELAAGSGSTPHVPIVDELACPYGVLDPTMRELGRALLPALESSQQQGSQPLGNPFFEHVARAIYAHLATRYGRSTRVRAGTVGRLSAWQQRIAKQLLCTDLAVAPSIPAVAQACNMPVSRFLRAFRRTMGVPPYRWLRGLRIERAKGLLFESSLSLAQIACDCGFADQSHFTRVFASSTGKTPGAWRQARRGAGELPAAPHPSAVTNSAIPSSWASAA